MSFAARPRLKRLSYASGALRHYHRIRNRETLTVVTFHRVLGAGDERWGYADPRYTMTDELFDACIAFFHDHYAVVDSHGVAAAARGEEQLPARSLLLTIDDGWADTEEYALPVLRRTGCTATVFVNVSAVGALAPFWQSRVFAAWRLGAADDDRLAKVWSAAAPGAPPPDNWRSVDSIRILIARLRPLDPSRRGGLVESLEIGMPAVRPQMLALQQLCRLRDSHVVVGGHGMTHEALAEAAGGARELVESRAALSEMLAKPVDTMSFPHGSYNRELLQAAREDYELVFTSEGWLNRLADRRPASSVFGRIGIPADAIVGPDERLRPELLALWLFRRPHRVHPEG